MNSVRTNQDIASRLADGLSGRAVNETRGRTPVVLYEGVEVQSGADFVFAQLFLRRFQEQHLQTATMHRVLRPAVAGIQSSRLTPDQLAEFVVVGKLGGWNGNRRQLLVESKEGQFPNGVGEQIQSNAERANRRDRLENGYVKPSTVQVQGRRQTGWTSSNDKNVQL